MAGIAQKPVIYRAETLSMLTIIAAIVLTRIHGYTLFHSLAEIFSVVVGLTAFSIAWNARRTLDTAYLLVAGLALGPVAVIDLLHTLAYKGMGVFPSAGADLPTQLWIAGRMVEVGGMAAGALWAVGSRPRPGPVLLTAVGITALLLAAIFWWRIFPDCWRDGRGLTGFKIGSEYLFMTVLGAILARLWTQRRLFAPDIFPYLAGSIALAIVEEGCFTLYADVYGLFNMAGHVAKIGVFYLVYAGLVRFGFARPQEILFHQLSRLNARLADEALRSNERASMALAAAGGAAWEWDMRTPAIRLTPRHGQWLGSPTPPTMAEFDKYVAASDRDHLAPLLAPRLDPAAREAELCLDVPGQSRRWIRRLTRVFAPEDGSPVMIGLDVDITAAKTAEMVRETLHRSLEQSHAELRRFSEILAHHLQEPVRSQVRYTQLLERLLAESLPPEGKEAMDFIVDGGERLRTLLRDVQLYLALDILPPPSKPCRSEDALASAWRRIAARVDATGATMEHEALPPVLIAPERLTDLFAILLENTLEYRDPARAPHIRITARSGKAEAQISVEDNGIGIEAEYLEKIFGVFERLYPRSVHPGTGIGLALARKIVESAGGRIWATSVPGVGSTFHFILPMQNQP